ncbi:MAG: hypothetical protein V1711_00880 [bacterium]
MLAVQANVEYWFRLLYECMRGACYGSPGFSELSSWFAHLWLWIVVIGYILSILGLLVIVYATMRIFELRKREKEYYSTVIPPPGADDNINSRWKNIETLSSGTSASEWREAIIEADIMLDDLLARHGYVGDGVGEKLKSVEPNDFSTLQDAWEAHKVRNQIAHEGSTFNLSESIAHRTIARYESVFREFKEI